MYPCVIRGIDKHDRSLMSKEGDPLYNELW